MQPNFKLNLLLGLFVGLIVGVNLLGVKITTLFGVSVSVGIFMVPFMFLITDIVEEVHGKALTTQFIWVGVITQIVIFLFVALFLWLEHNERYIYDNEYQIIFGASLRIIIASLVAFVLAQFHDVWAFNFWKERTHGQYLWLRNNASTIVSQGIDTFVFMFIAFWHVAPKFTAGFIITLAIPYYLFKIVFALLDTPFVYWGVKWLKK